jgi:DNA-binding transcriptional MerR regulator
MADDSRKLFYSIGEVAEIFHVNESTLRFWEKEFPTVIKPKKNAKGTRNYTKDDIENVRLIHFLLKEKGMTLAGARKKLREEKKGMTSQHELADRLKKIKSELLKLQSELGQPAQEAPEFAEEERISKRMVFAEPGSEMISVVSIQEEAPALELAMEELLIPEPHMDEPPVNEFLEAPITPESIFEESPFDFYEEASVETSEFEAEKFTIKTDEQEPEPEPTPEQNLFYEQPESVEPPKPEPSNDGWSGSLF